MANDIELVQLLTEAGEALHSLIQDAQDIMVRFLATDGIDADTAMAEIIALLDGPRQREIEGNWERAKTGKDRDRWVQ